MVAPGTLAPLSANHLGVLAFGDSITNGGGELQWGVALHSWALWVARGTGLPFTSYATDGALVGDVNTLQIPAFEQTNANPQARYELGCLYIGVNDVRALDWSPDRFERGHRRALEFLAQRCDRVLAVTAPLDLGRPRAEARVIELNAIIERAASESHALLLDLSDFAGRRLVMADHVHPTAFGQIAIAERALALLARDGLPTRAAPSGLINYQISWSGRIRAELTYAYRRAKETARGLRFKAARLRP
jgi:lysophospholipase L1-like esterase